MRAAVTKSLPKFFEVLCWPRQFDAGSLGASKNVNAVRIESFLSPIRAQGGAVVDRDGRTQGLFGDGLGTEHAH